jgi:hypothetical protein
MGITPISSLLPVSFASPAASALEPLPMARVENSGRTDDDDYSPSNAKSSRGSEDDTDESDGEEIEDDLAIESSADAEPRQVRSTPLRADGPRPVSFFA